MNHHFNPLVYCPVGTLKKSREHKSKCDNNNKDKNVSLTLNNNSLLNNENLLENKRKK